MDRGKLFTRNGTRVNPQFAGHVRVSVLDGVDDKVLIISCVHSLQIDFLVGFEDGSNKEPVQRSTWDHRELAWEETPAQGDQRTLFYSVDIPQSIRLHTRYMVVSIYVLRRPPVVSGIC